MSKELEFVIIWIVLLILLAISLYHNRIQKHFQKKIVFGFIILFSLMYAYRTLGMDFRNYVSFYNNTSLQSLRNAISLSNILNNEYEPLFMISVYWFKKQGFSFNLAMLLMVLAPSVIFYYIIKKNAKDYLIAYMFFMVIMMFHIDLTRLYIALPFAFLALNNRKVVPKVLLYMFALGFHYSVVMVLFCEVCYKFILKKKRYIYCLYGVTTVVTVYFKMADLSWAEASSFRFLFKFQYYLKYNNITYMGWTHQLLSFAINSYPIIMCMWMIKNLRSESDWPASVRELTDKIKGMLCVCLGIVVPFAIFFGSSQVVFRLLLPVYFALFIPMSYLYSNSIKNCKIRKTAMMSFFVVFLYDIIMAIYYVGVSIWA